MLCLLVDMQMEHLIKIIHQEMHYYHLVQQQIQCYQEFGKLLNLKLMLKYNILNLKLKILY